MFIDIHVLPAFYEPINGDPRKEELRHEALDIHLNGIAKLEHIKNQMRCAGLDKMALLAQDYRSEHGEPIVSNDEIRTLVDCEPDRFIGIASVDPLAPGAADELERAFTDLDLKGLHLHLGRSHIWPNDERLQPLFDICQAYNRPIIFNAGMSWEPGSLAKYGRPIEYEELAATRPRLRICLSRFGWPWAEECAMLMVKYPNVYTDTGILYFDSAREFFDRLFKHEVALTWVDRSLRHQVMFGSNNPRFEQIRMAQALDGLGLRESTVELIKGGNAIDFLGGLD